MLRLSELTAKVSASQVSTRRLDVGVARMEIEHSAGALGQLGTDREAGDMRGFQGVDHVEIVRPGLGKIFPGV